MDPLFIPGECPHCREHKTRLGAAHCEHPKCHRRGKKKYTPEPPTAFPDTPLIIGECPRCHSHMTALGVRVCDDVYCGMKFKKKLSHVVFNRKRHRANLSVSPVLRNHLKAIRGAACELCGSTHILQVHHKIPRRLGGTDADENLRLLCMDCHLNTVHQYGYNGIHTWEEEHKKKILQSTNA